MDDLNQAIDNLVMALSDFARSIAKVIEPISKQMHEAIKVIMPDVRFGVDVVKALNHYPNRRVAWLALHHPKARIRKKNLRRIIRWGNKEGYYL